MNDSYTIVVKRRLRVRDELNPLATWVGPVHADWLAIAHVVGPRADDSFQLALLRAEEASVNGEQCCGRAKSALLTWMDFETLKIAIDQAHAMFGVEGVEWEACRIEITNLDGTVSWDRAVPDAEQTRCSEPGDGTLVDN